jgi:hypothetical protein
MGSLRYLGWGIQGYGGNRGAKMSDWGVSECGDGDNREMGREIVGIE